MIGVNYHTVDSSVCDIDVADDGCCVGDILGASDGAVCDI